MKQLWNTCNTGVSGTSLSIAFSTALRLIKNKAVQKERGEVRKRSISTCFLKKKKGGKNNRRRR